MPKSRPLQEASVDDGALLPVEKFARLDAQRQADEILRLVNEGEIKTLNLIFGPHTAGVLVELVRCLQDEEPDG